MKKIQLIILTILTVNVLLIYVFLFSIKDGLADLTPKKYHDVYEWREIPTLNFSDLSKSIIVESHKKRGTADWEKKAWEEIRRVDFNGWEYVGTLFSSENKIIVLVRKRVIDA